MPCYVCLGKFPTIDGKQASLREWPRTTKQSVCSHGRILQEVEVNQISFSKSNECSIINFFDKNTEIVIPDEAIILGSITTISKRWTDSF